MNKTAAKIFLVEDDLALADALRLLFLSRGHDCAWFDTAEKFLAWLAGNGQWQSQACCAVMDVRMGQLSGIEAFHRINNSFPDHRMAVVFLTGHGDISMAVQALKDGAFDFMEKPLNDNRLVDRVEAALEHSLGQLQQSSESRVIRSRLERLSVREREVLDLIVAGKLNKVIAADLGISMRTVEVHRSSVFEKMQVRSAVELANLLAVLGPTGNTKA
jgi:two-component system, LuxR family, response regulator DctR